MDFVFSKSATCNLGLGTDPSSVEVEELREDSRLVFINIAYSHHPQPFPYPPHSPAFFLSHFSSCSPFHFHFLIYLFPLSPCPSSPSSSLFFVFFSLSSFFLHFLPFLPLLPRLPPCLQFFLPIEDPPWNCIYWGLEMSSKEEQRVHVQRACKERPACDLSLPVRPLVPILSFFSSSPYSLFPSFSPFPPSPPSPAFVYLVELPFCAFKNALLYPLSKCPYLKCPLLKGHFE